MEEDTTGKTLAERAMIETLEILKESLTILAEYAQKPHTQIYLDAQSSRSIIRANQEDQVASLRKFANNALEQCSETVCIPAWKDIKITSARW